MQKLYDKNMNLIGYLSEGAMGRLTLYDSDYHTRGYYYPLTDKTYDSNVRLVGCGNLLASLLEGVVLPV